MNQTTPPTSAPVILPLEGKITAAQVEAACPGPRTIFACDFYIEGAEAGTDDAGSLKLGRIINVDHHADLKRMRREITSTALAAAYVNAHGRDAARPAWVAINHTDCDSILSSAIMMGWLEPHQRYIDASIDADHRGTPNEIADALQALDEGRKGRRTEAQYLESLECVTRIDQGRELAPAAQLALRGHANRRARAKALVDSGEMTVEGGVAFVQHATELDGAFFPMLLPHAQLIVLAFPNRDDPAKWTVKVRRGPAAPEDVTLHSLKVGEMDASFGGRWNAGSNKRGGGTHIRPEDYARMLREKLAG